MMYSTSVRFATVATTDPRRGGIVINCPKTLSKKFPDPNQECYVYHGKITTSGSVLVRCYEGLWRRRARPEHSTLRYPPANETSG